MSADPTRRPMASVWSRTLTGAEAWLVAESPLEALEAVERAESTGEPFVELTLANPDRDVQHRWNGRPVYVRVADVTAIGPPLDDDD